MVNPITKELDEYLNQRHSESQDSKKKKRPFNSVYKKVPKIDDENRTLVLDEEEKKPWFKRMIDWLLEEENSESKKEEAIEEKEEAISDEINKTEEKFEELEQKEEAKVRNIFQRMLDKIRKIEDKEIREDYDVNEEQYSDMSKYKQQLNDDVRSALKTVDKILMKIPTDKMSEIKKSSDYQILEAIMHKYNVK